MNCIRASIEKRGGQNRQWMNWRSLVLIEWRVKGLRDLYILKTQTWQSWDGRRIDSRMLSVNDFKTNKCSTQSTTSNSSTKICTLKCDKCTLRIVNRQRNIDNNYRQNWKNEDLFHRTTTARNISSAHDHNRTVSVPGSGQVPRCRVCQETRRVGRETCREWCIIKKWYAIVKIFET